MTHQLKLKDGTPAGERAIKSCLDKLENHGILIRKEVKKSVFEKEGFAEKVGVKFAAVQYKDTTSTLSVYSFHSSLMLILRARLFVLRQNANKKVWAHYVYI